MGILKAETDKRDPFYIHRINNGKLDSGTDYVFKSSREMALLAIKMDVNNEEETGLQNKNAFFDVIHCRVFGFKSFALWLVHSSKREMICLTSMEMCTENVEDIMLFFRLFNEILQKVTGNDKYKFNPRCFLCDEAGANYKTIKLVRGEEFCKQRVCGCQFHFKQQVQKKKHEVPENMREEFIDTCNQLCKVTTVSKYNIHKKKLEEMTRVS